MAKSEGTGYSLQEILDKGFSALDLRYLFLQAHYRSQQNFTWEALGAAREAHQNLLSILYTPGVLRAGRIIQSYQKQFEQAITDDFNIPQALAVVWTAVNSSNKAEDILATVLSFDQVLGLKIKNSLKVTVPASIIDLAKQRQQLRLDKQYKQADLIRQTIEAQGYLVEDKDGVFVIKPKVFA